MPTSHARVPAPACLQQLGACTACSHTIYATRGPSVIKSACTASCAHPGSVLPRPTCCGSRKSAQTGGEHQSLIRELNVTKAAGMWVSGFSKQPGIHVPKHSPGCSHCSPGPPCLTSPSHLAAAQAVDHWLGQALHCAAAAAAAGIAAAALLACGLDSHGNVPAHVQQWLQGAHKGGGADAWTAPTQRQPARRQGGNTPACSPPASEAVPLAAASSPHITAPACTHMPTVASVAAVAAIGSQLEPTLALSAAAGGASSTACGGARLALLPPAPLPPLVLPPPPRRLVSRCRISLSLWYSCMPGPGAAGGGWPAEAGGPRNWRTRFAAAGSPPIASSSASTSSWLPAAATASTTPSAVSASHFSALACGPAGGAPEKERSERGSNVVCQLC